MRTRVALVWYGFLALWALTQLYFGAVRAWAVAAAAIGLALLNVLAAILLPHPLRIGKGVRRFLLLLGGIFLLQFLPLGPILYPYTNGLRRIHDVGTLWPGTADAFLTTYSFAQCLVYALTALLLLRLLQHGLEPKKIMAGVALVLLAQAAYGLIAHFAAWKTIPFYGDHPYLDSASGTLVNRNSFAGLMGMGLAVAVGLSLAAARTRRVERAVAWALLAVLFGAAIVLSKSRGGAIAAVTGAMVLLLVSGRRPRPISFAIVLLTGLGAAVLANVGPLVERFRTIDPYEIDLDSRWTYARTTIEAGLHQPILGFGVGTHRHAFHPFQPPELQGQLEHAHNEYVNFFFEGGVILPLALVGGLVFWLAATGRGIRRLAGPVRIHVAAALAGVSVTAIHSFVDFDLRITSVGMLFAVFLAVGGWARPPAAPSRIVPFVCAGIAMAAGLLLILGTLESSSRVREAAESDPDRAERLCRTALGLSPYDSQAAWEYARSAHRGGDLSATDRRMETAADLFPAHTGLQRDSGLYFWGRAQDARAARSFHRLFRADPAAVGSVLERIWDPKRPLDDYRKLLPDRPAAIAHFAGFLVAQGRWREAGEFFEEGCPPVAENAPLYDLFSDRLHAAGQWGLEAVLRERRLGVKSDAEGYAAVARAWWRVGVRDKAIAHARTSARLDPGEPGRHEFLGDLLRASGDGTAAAEAYTAAIMREQRQARYWRKRGEVYLSLRLFAPATDDFREVLRLRPDDRAATLGLARAWIGLGNRPEARRIVEAWLVLHPKDAEARRLTE